jgi:hypothetical protein
MTDLEAQKIIQTLKQIKPAVKMLEALVADYDLRDGWTERAQRRGVLQPYTKKLNG